MAKWLCEVTRDSENGVTGYIPKYKTTSTARPRGSDVEFLHDSGNVEIPMVVQTENGFTIIENDNALTLKTSYEKMDLDIRTESSIKIGTTNKDSMFAFVDAYQLRMMIPERYVGIGLKSELDIGAFAIGDALDTADKIKLYYTEVLFYLDTHRIGKIQEYLNVKSTLAF